MSLHDVSPSILHAARITTAYSTLYCMTFVNGLVTKKRFAAKYKAQGKTFNRYESLEMQTADRLTQNILEWYPVFMSPLWSLAMTNQLANDTTVTGNICVLLAWTYVGLRTWYFGLILKHGVNKSGMNVSLWKSTFPGYACLAFLHFHALKLLL
jgi:hypothetical protein